MRDPASERSVLRDAAGDCEKGWLPFDRLALRVELGSPPIDKLLLANQRQQFIRHRLPNKRPAGLTNTLNFFLGRVFGKVRQ